jgi:hypothetical protein
MVRFPFEVRFALTALGYIEHARSEFEQLYEFMVEQGYDEKTKFLARLEFEEVLIATLRRERL